ncbi:MAG: alpha/beta hydrolase [Cytophagales bacterium]|nr:MAG: alpha/beta hydrolase [Cytophagales bacterium]TAF61938.1 MAG: alpha/beta hydrolase [Cytophagales bacterium]
MKKHLLFSLLLLLCLLASGASQAQNTPEIHAGLFFKSFWERDTTTCLNLGDSLMRVYVSGSKLNKIQADLATQFGKLVRTEASTSTTKPEFTEVFLPCLFERTGYGFVVNVNNKNEVVGFFLKPLTQGGQDPASKYTKPVYDNPNVYTETALTIKNESFELPAILTMPKGKKNVPVLVFVHGSGPNDYDETIYSTKLFRDLAVGLAAQGVGSLRYTKRTKAYPNFVTKDLEKLTVEDEVISDAIKALKTTENLENVDKKQIYLLGHSLGAMLAPVILKNYKKEAGMILLAGTVRPLEDLILEQVAYLSANDSSQNAVLGIKIMTEQVQNVKNNAQKTTDFSKDLPLGLPINYWLSLSKLQLAQDVTAYQTKPVLVLQGRRDYQVPYTEVETYKNLLKDNKKAAFKIYEKLNHLFMEGEGRSTPTEYYNVTNMPLEVAQDIASFVQKQANK